MTTTEIDDSATNGFLEPPSHATIELRCHRHLRGPYTGGGQLLRTVVPELAASDLELNRSFSTAVVAIAPDLAGLVPTRPRTLTDLAMGDERTRFYGLQRTRDLGFLVSGLVRVWASTCHPDGVTLRFHELADADPTDTELFETVRRRCASPTVHVEDAGPLPTPVTAAPQDDPAQLLVDADGTSDSSLARVAYAHLPESERRARHSARARLLIERAEPGSELGAIPYHLERGTDPHEAAPWLVAGQNQAFREGFYDAALDLGRRGRALVSWSVDPRTHNYLTKRVIGALTYLSRCDEAMALIDQHRITTIELAEQMNDAYMMAMIYTRHLEPGRRDQDRALAWVNTALALSAGEREPERHAFYGAFMRNARALVELHRGNLRGSLDLVEEAIEIADAHLDADKHQLHRTVLINNRARVLLGLKDYDGALRAFDEVLARDPEYDEPYFDRAVAHKARGDLDAALRDLDRAVELSVAFSDAYYNRADIWLDLGDETRALADLNTVLDIDPDYLEALLNRAALFLAAGELDHAETDIDRGLRLSPDNANLWSAKGLLQAERGADDAALDCYAEALTRNPGLAEAFGNRAVLHFSAGRVADAVSDLDQAIALTDTAELRINRGVGRHALGDFDAAIKDFDTALTMPGVDRAAALLNRSETREAMEHRTFTKLGWRHTQIEADLDDSPSSVEQRVPTPDATHARQ